MSFAGRGAARASPGEKTGQVKPLLLLLLLVPVPSVAASLSGLEIMNRNEATRKYPEIVAEARLVLGEAGVSKSERKFTWWRKEAPGLNRFNSLARFSAPAEIRGEGVLFLEGQGTEKQVFLYLPAYKKTRRVENDSQGEDFMGSTFSYYDMTSSHPDEYEHTLKKTDPCPQSKGGKCFVVESIPKTPAVVENTGYARVKHWIQTDSFVEVSAEYYGKDGILKKKLMASDSRPLDDHRKLWLSYRVQMDDLIGKRFSVFQIENAKIDSGIPDYVFSRQNLASER